MQCQHHTTGLLSSLVHPWRKIYDGEVVANWLGIIIITTTTKG